MIKPFLIGSGMVVGIVGLSGGAILYIRAHQVSEPAVSSNGRPISLSLTDTTRASTASKVIATPASNSANKTDSSALRVSNPALGATLGQPGSTSTSSTAVSAPAIPGPDSFGQYDQYKNNTEALFGELKMGEGASAELNKKVSVNYRGWLTNGKEFDESYSRGQPFVFTIGEHRVILGWEEAILGMKVGGKRRFIVPPSVGYREQTQGTIPPNSLLVFDVELVAVQ